MVKKNFIFHKPSTIDVFAAIKDGKEFIKPLIGDDREYSEFLKGLFDNDFFESEDITTLKLIAERLSISPSKITKWVKEIYFDIFLLNEEHPELFIFGKTLHKLYFSYYDNNCTFYLDLQGLLMIFLRSSLLVSAIKLNRGFFSFNSIFFCFFILPIQNERY